MEKLWKGLSQGNLSIHSNEINSSIRICGKMWAEDIDGSIAHARMLGACGIITAKESGVIVQELGKIKSELQNRKLVIDEKAEDIHSFIEAELTRRLGDVGKKLHTARSRNDQVATDTKMYLRTQIREVQSLIKNFISVLVKTARLHIDTIMPGFTHLQPAQPVTLAHHLLAYCAMLGRDNTRLENCKNIMNFCPLGAGALAGTTFPINRDMAAKELGFCAPTLNSMDTSGDRDHIIELASCLSILMMHLSRLAEEIIIWNTPSFGFISLGDEYSTGSSMMPNKKNPDMAELVRGKCGRVYGVLFNILTTMKALPLTYNKDMQEDKEAIFDALGTSKLCLEVMAGMIETAVFHADKMLEACRKGFINATDCADYLVAKGVPFREAYQIVGGLVAVCIEKGKGLEDLPLSDYQVKHEKFEKDIYKALEFGACVARRGSLGGPSRKSVLQQIKTIETIYNK